MSACACTSEEVKTTRGALDFSRSGWRRRVVRSGERTFTWNLPIRYTLSAVFPAPHLTNYTYTFSCPSSVLFRGCGFGPISILLPSAPASLRRRVHLPRIVDEQIYPPELSVRPLGESFDSAIPPEVHVPHFRFDLRVLVAHRLEGFRPRRGGADGQNKTARLECREMEEDLETDT